MTLTLLNNSVPRETRESLVNVAEKMAGEINGETESCELHKGLQKMTTKHLLEFNTIYKGEGFEKHVKTRVAQLLGQKMMESNNPEYKEENYLSKKIEEMTEIIHGEITNCVVQIHLNSLSEKQYLEESYGNFVSKLIEDGDSELEKEIMERNIVFFEEIGEVIYDTFLKINKKVCSLVGVESCELNVNFLARLIGGKLIAENDEGTFIHSKNVAEKAEQFFDWLVKKGVIKSDPIAKDRLKTAMILHDIGKIYPATVALVNGGKFSEKFRTPRNLIGLHADGIKAFERILHPEIIAIGTGHHDYFKDLDSVPNGVPKSSKEGYLISKKIGMLADVGDACHEKGEVKAEKESMQSGRAYKEGEGGYAFMMKEVKEAIKIGKLDKELGILFLEFLRESHKKEITANSVNFSRVEAIEENQNKEIKEA